MEEWTVESTTSPARPTGVVIVAIVFLLGALLNIVTSTDVLGIMGAGGARNPGDLDIPVGVLMLVSAVLLIIGAYGLWVLAPWGWMLGVVVMAAGLVLNVLQYLNDNTLLVPMLVSALIPVAILWYLFQPHVRAAFGRT
jgi:uncharacterized membrane protein (DUF2068 family)